MTRRKHWSFVSKTRVYQGVHIERNIKRGFEGVNVISNEVYNGNGKLIASCRIDNTRAKRFATTTRITIPFQHTKILWNFGNILGKSDVIHSLCHHSRTLCIKDAMEVLHSCGIWLLWLIHPFNSQPFLTIHIGIYERDILFVF